MVHFFSTIIRTVIFLCICTLSTAQAPKGAIYTLDQGHSLMDFTARHQGFGRVRGTFNEYRASMFFVPDQLEASSVTAIIKVASLDTQNPGRDEHIKKVFFNADEYPIMVFKSTRIKKVDGVFRLFGELTIKDVTKTIELPLEVLTLDGVDQWDNKRIVLETSITINRRDYNVVYSNKFWDGIVSDEIKIDISFGASHYNANNSIFPWRKKSIATLIKNGMEEEGLEATLKKVKTLHEENPDDYQFGLNHFYRAGLATAQNGQIKEGIQILELGLQMNIEQAEASDLGDIYATIAELHFNNQEKAKAKAVIQKALAIDPNNPSALELNRYLK